MFTGPPGVRGSESADSDDATHLDRTASIPCRGREEFMMERRVFIAIILSFLVMYAYQSMFVRTPSPATQTAQQPTPTQGSAPTATPAQPTEVAPPEPAAPPPAARLSESAEREITVDTATVEAVLTNRGGRLIHWRLRDYRDGQGHLVDLVPSGLPPAEQLPFALRVDDDRLSARLNSAIYHVSGDNGGRVDARTTAATVTFEYQDESGLDVK